MQYKSPSAAIIMKSIFNFQVFTGLPSGMCIPTITVNVN